MKNILILEKIQKNFEKKTLYYINAILTVILNSATDD